MREQLSVQKDFHTRKEMVVMVITVLTCHRRKSLSLTSPDVLMTRSGGGESPVYRHLSNTSSDTSLEEKQECAT